MSDTSIRVIYQKMYKCIYINIRWFGTATSSTNKTDCHDITEILSKIEFKIPDHNI
jgi:hypothetical protein